MDLQIFKNTEFGQIQILEKIVSRTLLARKLLEHLDIRTHKKPFVIMLMKRIS